MWYVQLREHFTLDSSNKNSEDSIFYGIEKTHKTFQIISQRFVKTAY